MDKLRLLIVDDNEDKRIVLKAICKKVDGFEIQESTNNNETVMLVKSWQPHITLVDMLTSNIDGIKLSKIIKQTSPETVIIALTQADDSKIQDNLSAIGIDIYLHEPLERELVRYKLQSVSSSLRLKLSNFKNLSKRIAFNPFQSEIRSFKTVFDITDLEAMMDFGMWLFDQYNGKSTNISAKLDKTLELFYLFMTQGRKNNESMSIIIEESCEEFYITMKFDDDVVLNHKLSNMICDFNTDLIVKENIICMRLAKPMELKTAEVEKIQTVLPKPKVQEKTPQKKEISIVKKVKVIDSKEKELLKQSFVNKTSAVDYIDEIGGDVLDEIRDLTSIDEEWMMQLRIIEEEPTITAFTNFADSVLGVYVKAINNLFEFAALAYALSSLGTFIKDSAGTVSQDTSKIKMLVMLLEHLGTDLTSWREHIFIMQDTADIHYLDSSFFSSCMQIEGIISDKNIGAHDDDNDMEFF